MTRRIGIVGFGEAGSSIAAGLVKEGAEVVATDARLDTPAGDELRRRAEEGSVALVASIAEVVPEADVVLSLVTANAAEPVAKALAGHVAEGQLVADLNSTSPGLARRVGEILAPSGASFVDVSVMAAVPPNGHRVPMLASGPDAARFVELATDLGMQVELVGEEIGAASAVKMLRSLLVKGLEVLLLDACLAADRYGATERVLTSMNGGLPMHDWQELATYLLGRTAQHAERRGHELEEAAATLEELGMDPGVPHAGARRLLWAASQGLQERFGSRLPDHYDEVLDALQGDSR